MVPHAHTHTHTYITLLIHCTIFNSSTFSYPKQPVQAYCKYKFLTNSNYNIKSARIIQRLLDLSTIWGLSKNDSGL